MVSVLCKQSELFQTLSISASASLPCLVHPGKTLLYRGPQITPISRIHQVGCTEFRKAVLSQVMVDYSEGTQIKAGKQESHGQTLNLTDTVCDNARGLPT